MLLEVAAEQIKQNLSKFGEVRRILGNLSGHSTVRRDRSSIRISLPPLSGSSLHSSHYVVARYAVRSQDEATRKTYSRQWMAIISSAIILDMLE